MPSSAQSAIDTNMDRGLALGLGVAGAAAVGVACSLSGLSSAVSWTAATTVLCATWWIFEPIPIPATSLVPFALLPLVGVLDHERVAASYGHTLILLLLGGFILSTAMERSGAHRRLALGLARLLQSRAGHTTPRRLVLGFMLAAAFASMWISNAATTLVLVPIALAALERTRDEGTAAAVLLGVCYAASIGGLGTPIGTPPNLLFMASYAQVSGSEITFLDWMRIGVPVVVLLVPAAFLLLTRRLPSAPLPGLVPLGPWTTAERRVLFVFLLTALAWVTRAAPSGGWQGLLGLETPGDATVALAAVVALFLLPDGRGERLLDWKSATAIPWGILLLFGGGLALAEAFHSSGLSALIGARVAALAGVPVLFLIGAVCLAVTFLTEVTSNTATVALLMPLLASTATSAGLDPAHLMLPAALSGSCAFMLPVATAPNAIVFGTGRVSTAHMARTGFWLNLVGVLVITVVCWQLL
jgi:sodium-dependent dicarboxylate transporter 2/3/5